MKRTLSRVTLTELTPRELELAKSELDRRHLPYDVSVIGRLFDVTVRASLPSKDWDEIIEASWNNSLIKEKITDIVLSLTPNELWYVVDSINQWDEKFRKEVKKVSTPKDIIDVLTSQSVYMPKGGAKDEKDYFMKVFEIEVKADNL